MLRINEIFSDSAAIIADRGANPPRDLNLNSALTLRRVMRCFAVIRQGSRQARRYRHEFERPLHLDRFE